jgi:hypothetical protein
MDEQNGSSMLDGTDFVARLDAVQKRLDQHAAAETPTGLTEPEPGGTERWEAGQVWAHMAEFIGYWRGEIEHVMAEFAGEPVPFGRTITDSGRLAGIEMGRRESVQELAGRARAEIEDLKSYTQGLTSSEWNAVGLHPTRGEMDVEAIVGRFIVEHLEEHADQLDGLVAAASDGRAPAGRRESTTSRAAGPEGPPAEESR